MTEAPKVNTPRPKSDRELVAPLLLLTLVTGIVDAASVLGLGHVFTANMTGNVVFLGFALGGSGTVSVAASLTALASFLAGAAVGGRIDTKPSRRLVKRGLGLELGAMTLATVIAALAPASTTAPVVALLALSMGLRNAVIRKLGIADMTTTVLTLTLTGLAADSSLAGGSNPRWPRRVASFASMLAGALLGARLLPLGVPWVVGAAAAVEAFAVLMLVRASHALEASPPS